LLSEADSSILGGQLIAWRISTDGDEHFLAILLARCHITLDVGARAEDGCLISILVNEVLIAIASIGKVGPGKSKCAVLSREFIDEANRDYVDSVIVAKVGQRLLIIAISLHHVSFYQITLLLYLTQYTTSSDLPNPPGMLRRVGFAEAVLKREDANKVAAKARECIL
jgi:hypothetical protein